MGGKTIGALLGAALCLAALSGCAGPASLKGTTWYYSTGSEVKSIQFSGEASRMSGCSVSSGTAS